MSLGFGFKMIVGIAFGFLFLWLFTSHNMRCHLKNKTHFEWFLDLSNLSIQGTFVPLVQTTLLFQAFDFFAPQFRGFLSLSVFTGFALNFFFVDYLYYWNHRLLHQRRLFPIHVVHHTVSTMDVMATSRNSLWTSFFIVYLWANGLLLYLTDLNTGVLLGMSLSAALDLWKHSSFGRNHLKLQHKFSRYGMMTPLDHAWHHAQRLNKNYGANLNVYDKIHGTYHAEAKYPERLGVKIQLGPLRQLLFPFS